MRRGLMPALSSVRVLPAAACVDGERSRWTLVTARPEKLTSEREPTQGENGVYVQFRAACAGTSGCDVDCRVVLCEIADGIVITLGIL